MAQEMGASRPSRRQQVDYHSYLLRLRWVREGGAVRRQVYLRDIPSQEELYFRSLAELVDYLQAQGTLHWEMAWDEENVTEE